MNTSTAGARPSSARDRMIGIGCAILGALALVTALTMAVDPAGFLDGAGGFGTVNEHLVRDLATWTATLGVTLLAAARIASWRVPLLAFAALQGALHAINHAFDADLADPGWKGWGTVAVQLALTGVIVWLLVAAHRQETRS